MSKYVVKSRSLVRKLLDVERTVFTKNRQVAASAGLYAKWSSSKSTERNLGDSLNPLVIEHLTGKKAWNVERVWYSRSHKIYYFMGSILDNLYHPNAVVCGAGFKSASSKLYSNPTVLAVRGPLTRRRMLEYGVECPEVFCDPGLFASDLFPQKPSIGRDPLVGIIPHFIDSDRLLGTRIHDSGLEFCFLDIKDDPASFFHKLSKCSVIASSSLHGLIFSASYGIPCVRLIVSDQIAGGDFKFDDFYASVGLVDYPSIEVQSELDLSEIVTKAKRLTVEHNKTTYLRMLSDYKF